MLRLASRRPFLPFSLRAAAGSGPDVALRRELRTEQQRRWMSGEKEEQDSTQEGEAAKVAEDAAAPTQMVAATRLKRRGRWMP